ncbi:MAG: hypothetical protein KKA75_02260, partial [Proteobacteria bacterium]|nr:hypothetical protein [Pseudomonadota bacterium]
MTKLTVQINKKLTKSIILYIIIVISVFFAPFKSYGYEYKRENAVVMAVRKVSPAVVNISSEFEVRKRSNPFSG